MKNKIPLLLSAFLCFLTITAFLGCSSMKEEVARYKGDGEIKYAEEFSFAPFIKNRGFYLVFPSFDLSKAQEKTYSLTGIPTSKPIEVKLSLIFKAGQVSPDYNGSITLRIIAKNGFVAFSQEHKLPNDNIDENTIMMPHYNLGSVTLKADNDYRLEMKYRFVGTDGRSGDGGVVLDVPTDSSQETMAYVNRTSSFRN